MIKILDKQEYDFIFLLKAIAILLITNSHFKLIYYGNLSQFAFGGAFGCALFFFCSGYTMIESKNEKFGKYLLKRLVRLYPALWIFYICTGQFKQAPILWVWNDFYWFLQAIVLFYFLFYFVRKYAKAYLLHLIIGLFCSTVTIYCFVPHNEWMIDYTLQWHHITWFYYFAIMLFGGLIKITQTSPLIKTTSINQSINNIMRFFASVGCFLLVYGLKAVCTKKIELNDLQLCFPLLLMAACYVYFIVWRSIKFNKNWLGKVIKFIASITLEIYVVQFFCIAFCQKFSYPYRIPMVIVMILALAWVLHVATAELLKWTKIEKILKK